MSQQLGENYKEIIMNVDVETRDNLLEYVTLWTLKPRRSMTLFMNSIQSEEPLREYTTE